jgi:metal-dependent amidase/aminoacylase/carboxypeptidase family protein
MANVLSGALGGRHKALLDQLTSIYTDLNRHPELSMHEYRTATIAADYGEALGYEVTREVGATGVVAVLRNGDGPTVMLRADMDGRPMREDAGLPYARPASAREDFSVFGRAWNVPYVFWFVGGTDQVEYTQARQHETLSQIPSNHSPRFASVIHPTLETGVQARLAAAGAWLGADVMEA